MLLHQDLFCMPGPIFLLGQDRSSLLSNLTDIQLKSTRKHANGYDRKYITLTNTRDYMQVPRGFISYPLII